MILALFLLAAMTADDCTPNTPRLAILGSYHFGNPGQDAINVEADDVLAERRQRELNTLLDQLAKYQPTKIAIESPHYSTTRTDQYSAFRKGQHTLGRNEIEQIGFRLAANMNHDKIYPVDFPMWMSGLQPSEMHKPKPKPPQPPQPKPERAIAEEKRLRSSTVTEYLHYLNSPEKYIINHRWDVIENLAPGDGVDLYERTDLAANWYKRNLRIFTNILEVAKPDDRILLLIGAGHKKILTDLAVDHPGVCLVDVREYLK